MSEIHNGLECFSGYVYVEPPQEEHARRMRPCWVCAERDFIARLGGREMTWQNWIHRDELAHTVSTFAEWFPRGENHACLLHGGYGENISGNGKTHLLSAAGIEYIRRGNKVRYWNAADLAENKFEPWFIEAIGEFKGIVIIDDLGNDPNYPMNRDSVDRLLDYRYRSRRATIVATRLPLGSVQDRYHRFHARMNAGTRIECSAPPFDREHRHDDEESPINHDNHEAAIPIPADRAPTPTLFTYADADADQSSAR